MATTKKKNIPGRAAAKVYPENKSNAAATEVGEEEFLGYRFDDGDALDANEVNELQDRIAQTIHHVHNEVMMHTDYVDPTTSGVTASAPSKADPNNPVTDYESNPDVYNFITDEDSFRHRGKVIEIQTTDTNGGLGSTDGVAASDLTRVANFDSVENAIANLGTNHAHDEDHILTVEGGVGFNAEFLVTVTGTGTASTPSLFLTKTTKEHQDHPSGLNFLNDADFVDKAHSMGFRPASELIPNMRITAVDAVTVVRSGVDITSTLSLTTDLVTYDVGGDTFDLIEVSTIESGIRVDDAIIVDGTMSYKTLAELRPNIEFLHVHTQASIGATHGHDERKITTEETSQLFAAYADIDNPDATVMHFAKNAAEGALHGGANMNDFGFEPNIVDADFAFVPKPVLYLADVGKLAIISVTDVHLDTANGVTVLAVSGIDSTGFDEIKMVGNMQYTTLDHVRPNLGKVVEAEETIYQGATTAIAVEMHTHGIQDNALTDTTPLSVVSGSTNLTINSTADNLTISYISKSVYSFRLDTITGTGTTEVHVDMSDRVGYKPRLANLATKLSADPVYYRIRAHLYAPSSGTRSVVAGVIPGPSSELITFDMSTVVAPISTANEGIVADVTTGDLALVFTGFNTDDIVNVTIEAMHVVD